MIDLTLPRQDYRSRWRPSRRRRADSQTRTASNLAPSTTERKTAPLLVDCQRTASVRSMMIITVMLLIIGGVSAFDSFLTIKYQESLAHLELNPCCRWIMGLKHPGHEPFAQAVETDAMALFLGLKMAGTVGVMVTIQGLFMWRELMGLAVGIGVAICQLGLAGFLTLGIC